MSEKCLSCKRKFGLFNQANIICDREIELCNDCYDWISSSYVSYNCSQYYGENEEQSHILARKLHSEVNHSPLSSEAKIKIIEWVNQKEKSISFENKVNSSEDNKSEVISKTNNEKSTDLSDDANLSLEKTQENESIFSRKEEPISEKTASIDEKNEPLPQDAVESESHTSNKDSVEELIAEIEELKRQVLILRREIEQLQRQQTPSNRRKRDNSSFCKYNDDHYCVKYDFYPTYCPSTYNRCSYSERQSINLITKEGIDDYLISHLEEIFEEIKEMKYSGAFSKMHMLDRLDYYESIIEAFHRLI